MNATGNDIIALSAINSTRTKQPGFYSKILSTSEQALYHDPHFSAVSFENFVWLLWSIKESAFKYLERSTLDLIFSPTKFIVQQLQTPPGYSIANFETIEMEGIGFDTENTSVIKGTIKIETDTLYSRSIIYNELIVSVVSGDEKFENTGWGIKLISKPDSLYQSIAVREFLVRRLQSQLQMDNLTIEKNHQGFPVVMEGSEKLAIPVSLSHHDHLVAYSFLHIV